MVLQYERADLITSHFILIPTQNAVLCALMQYCLIIQGRIISELFVSDIEIIANRRKDGKKPSAR